MTEYINKIKVGDNLYEIQPNSSIEITYPKLLNLRNTGKLVPGTWYRITDYKCILKDINYVQSANHQFDILVHADTENRLNENARACLHRTNQRVCTIDGSYNGEINDQEVASANIHLKGFVTDEIKTIDGSDYYIVKIYEGNIVIDLSIISQLPIDTNIHSISIPIPIGNNDGALYFKSKETTDIRDMFTFNNDDELIGLDNVIETIGNELGQLLVNGITITNKVELAEDQYFLYSNIESWQLKYCIDNDSSRFNWVKMQNTGVIYWMKDNLGNEAPYDFKNIQFARYPVNLSSSDTNIRISDFNDLFGESYFFGLPNNTDNWNDYTKGKITFQYINNKPEYYYTFGGKIDLTVSSSYSGYVPTVYNNIIKACYDENGTQYLNNGVFIHIGEEEAEFHNNTFGYGCHDWSMRGNCCNCTCGNDCSGWLCGPGCDFTCGDKCINWVCGEKSFAWKCGNDCKDWAVGNKCSVWEVGDLCSNWVCVYNSYNWKCERGCVNWTIGESCHDLHIESNCNNWEIGKECINMVINPGCNYFKILSNVSNSIVSSGTSGSNENPLTITFTQNVIYPQIAGFDDNSGTLVLKIRSVM